MKTILTGPRAEQAAYLLSLRRGRRISADEYALQKARLERAEAGVQKRKAKAAAKREAKREAERQARAAARAVRLVARGTPVTNDDLYDLWRPLAGRTLRVIQNQGERDAVMDIPASYKDFRRNFLVSYLNEDYDADFSNINFGTLLFVEPTPVSARQIAQRFRDGIDHCVFTPLFSFIETQQTKTNSKSALKRWQQRAQALQCLAKLYEAGVPEDKMEEVAKVVGCKINLVDVMQNVIKTYNEHGRNGTVRFMNTRINHVENLVKHSDPKEVSESEMVDIWNTAKSGWYMIDGDIRNGKPRAIHTLAESYTVANPIGDACKKFDQELNISQYRLNATKYPEVNEFLKAGRIVNGWSCTINNIEATACADMPAAYSQFKRCEYYQGFMGHIHQWRQGSFDRTFMEQHIGFYRVTPTSTIPRLFEAVGLQTNESTILFSAEILYFMDNGITFTCDAGVWGSRFDFEFPEYMLENRAYCHWSGRLGMERKDKSFTFPGDADMAALLKSQGNTVFHWSQENLITLRQPAKAIYTAHHILGAITAYVRIQMLEAMKHFNINNIARVVMDGIYYKGEKPAALSWFKDKPAKKGDGHSMTWYSEALTSVTFPEQSKIVRNSLLAGQGGAGKTYSIFADKGFNDVLFVTPSHVLGQDVREKYGARYTTIHKLIGIDCQPYKNEMGEPAVILVDEITQLDAAWVNKAIDLYPRSLVLLAGDIDSQGRHYQCRSGDGSTFTEVWKPANVDVIEFTQDRRSRDQQLADLKLAIRDEMRNVYNDPDACYLMKRWAHENLTFETFVDIKPEDTVIAATHEFNKLCLSNGFVTGYYKKGGYISKTEQPGYEARGSFTIHSFQGKTVDTGRVWIYVDDMFEYAMLYTAVSRAVNFDQLRFIRKPTD